MKKDCKYFDEDLVRRAAQAYIKSSSGAGHVLQQPSKESLLATVEGRGYVVLCNVCGILAVYRVRSPSQRLKRLKRWPNEFKRFSSAGGDLLTDAC